jgi:ATP-dependent Lon protease
MTMTETDTDTTRAHVPVLVARKLVPTPGVVSPLEVGRPRSLSAVEAALSGEKRVLVVPQRDPDEGAPDPEGLYDVGVMAEIVQETKHGKSHRTVVLKYLERQRVEAFEERDTHLVATVAPFASVMPADPELAEEMIASIKHLMISILSESAESPEQVKREILDIEDPDDLVDLAVAHLDLSREEQIHLLVESEVMNRLGSVLPALERYGEVLQVKSDIREELIGEMSGVHREKVLRDRMRSIKEELGEQDEDTEIDEYLERIAESEMPDEIRQVAKKQVARMRMAGSSSPEYNVARTYLEWLLDLPWGVYTEDTIDVPAARGILDHDHAGLDKVKKRIVEFIAVRKLAPHRKGPILCLVGPPGVGKTSLGRSVATSLGRKYVRVSLGGLRDESEVRGHRRTYIGALPGRLIGGLKKAGSMSPVFVLDEIDKMASGIRGDPASALLEALDPEQNREFVDHYLEVPVDLSKVMFIATANDTDTIPPALMDRLEIIRIPGYTEAEKLEIGREYIIPKQMREHGLEPDQLSIEDPAIRTIIHHYTREAGVRNLERELAAVCRQAAVKVASSEAEAVRVGEGDVEEILGPKRFFSEVAAQRAQIGVSTALAWTPTGGDLLFVETRLMPGKGELKLTGQVGDVMSESAQASLSYLRANAARFDIDPAHIATSDIHVHVPSGAIRKDGPSAGLAMTVALVSLLTRKPVRPDVAITGEMTLRGTVLPVGGIKEKVLAAHRGDAKTVVLPERNRKDLEEIPQEVREDLEIRFVKRVDEAIELATGLRARPPAIPPEMVPPKGASPSIRPAP